MQLQHQSLAKIPSGIYFGIFYSWIVYALNDTPLMYEEVKSNLPEFKPFDRFLYVGEKSLRHRKESFVDVKNFEKFNVKGLLNQCLTKLRTFTIYFSLVKYRRF